MMLVYSVCSGLSVPILKVNAIIAVVYNMFKLNIFQAAKMSKYCGKKTLCDILLGVFIIVWFVSRFGFYPFRLV